MYFEECFNALCNSIITVSVHRLRTFALEYQIYLLIKKLVSEMWLSIPKTQDCSIIT